MPLHCNHIEDPWDDYIKRLWITQLHVSEYTFGKRTLINWRVKCSDLDHEHSDQSWANQTTFIEYCQGVEECNSLINFVGAGFDDLVAINLHHDFKVADMNNSKIYKVSHLGKVKQLFNSFQWFLAMTKVLVTSMQTSMILNLVRIGCDKMQNLYCITSLKHTFRSACTYYISPSFKSHINDVLGVKGFSHFWQNSGFTFMLCTLLNKANYI